MRRAIFRQLHGKPRAPIRDEELREIADALQRLHDIYQAELARTLPPRKHRQDDLVQTAALLWLIDSERQAGRDLAFWDAVKVLRLEVRVESDSYKKSFQNRARVLGRSFLYGIDGDHMPQVLKLMRRGTTQLRWDRRRRRRKDSPPQ